MYEIMKNVIESGRYELMDILFKIDTVWVQGGITEDERTNLISIARKKADPENSYASVQRQIENIYNNMEEMARAIQANADAITLLQGGEVLPPVTKEWPEYRQPTGAHDAYKTGDKITFNEKHHICVAPEGIFVVWPPDVMPEYWQEA